MSLIWRMFLSTTQNKFLKKIKAIYLKELKELKRDKISRIIVFVVPFVMMIIFGYGMALDVKHIPFTVLDEDKTSLSRELIYKFINNKEYFNFYKYSNSQNEIINLIDKNIIRFGLVIPSNFTERLKNRKTAKVQVLIDGVFPYRADVIKSYVTSMINSFTLEINNIDLSSNLKINVRYWFNENLENIKLTTSGLLAIILFINPAIFASLLIVKEKEYGSIYNIYTSSISKFEYLFGKQLFAVSVSIINFIVEFLLIKYLFGIPFKGNLPLFILSTFLYILVSTSLGLLMSTFLKTQVSAIVGISVIAIIPAFLYSGYLVPVSSMSKEAFIQAHIYPTFYYMNIIKMNYLKGVNINLYTLNSIILLVFYIILFSLTYLLFKKKER
ncbi:multidrug ABC transporter, permease [Deferribacter desulfuricans SSM1]|uniref:Multidrug ABC transporter, permease n=2 Tax=Deferribacter TaxID=53572 RepID=D3P8K7_DEFDS|nr:multidrug ABC transporter, permease [Deferribacter desulfuricans SSM1]